MGMFDPLRLVLYVFVPLVCFTQTGVTNFVITTPRKWTIGENVQVCVFSPDPTSSENSISLTLVKRNDESQVLLPARVIQLPPGTTELCDKVSVPLSLSANREGKLKITGNLGDKKVTKEGVISLVSGVSKTFIQPDKALYKAGQKVQFRVLTLDGPFLKVSTEQYPLMYIENPTGSRIAQWNNVDNPSGLIHESFQLSDEPEEGIYKIKVKPKAGAATVSKTFKVEEYTLPRFEVKVHAPKYILGTDESFIFNVCAKYTYGQPVKGNLTFEVGNGGWGASKHTHTVKEKINGCKDITVTSEDVQLNGDHYYVYRLNAKATIEEEGTGEKFNGEASAEIKRTAISFKGVGRETYIKPALPFTGKVKAEFPDNSPAAEEPMEICAGGKCKNITTSAEGILEFVIPTYETGSVSIKALNYKAVQKTDSWRSVMYESSYRQDLKKYFSPSNSSLIIHAPEGFLGCNPDTPKENILPVLYAVSGATKAAVTVQVVSRGQIQYFKTEEHEFVPTDLPINADHLLGDVPPVGENHYRGVIRIPIILPPSASPKAKVLVWFVRDDGEVVSDTQEIEITKCYTNDVHLSWSHSKVEPGQKSTLTLSAEKKSTCSLGVVDKSVELLSSQADDLTLEKVFKIVENSMVKEWDNAQMNDYEYCRKQGENKPTEIPPPLFIPDPPGPPGPPGPIAMPVAPEEEEEMVNGGLRTKRSYYRTGYSNYADALKMIDMSGLYFFTDLTVETRPCEFRRSRWRGSTYRPTSGWRGSAMSIGSSSGGRSRSRSGNPHSGTEIIRNYFPETMLWRLFSALPSGQYTEELTLPDTITEWVGKAVCVHPEKGLGVSNRASITTFTTFFTDLTLPPSVKRGELLPVMISVFNYLDEALPVKVVLEESSEYEIIETPSTTGPQSPKGVRSSCIPQQEKVVHTIKIRPLAIGDVNITVSAFVDELYPSNCGPEYVISKKDLLIKPIKVEVEGFPREKTWTKYICSKDIQENQDYIENWRVEAPSNIVEDSARGWVTAVGDLLGPTLENLGSLVKMPYGCGEQNMLNFAPNIFILQYLEASKQSTPEIANKAIEYMQAGYQRELKYRHEDGSYSAFGSSDASGSTWLTAFVLKSFAQARQFVKIDEDDLSMSQEWLKRNQLENGCFNSVGKVFHKGMKGGISGDGSPVPLTAYVLIALLEAGESSTSKAISEAAYCLNGDNSDNPYTSALKAYALALSKESTTAEAAIQDLISKAKQDTTVMYWELPEGSGMSEAVGVETAGYAILAMMTLNSKRYENEAFKIVKWMSSKRNGQGGFISTQDTVVALQALASFESHQSHGETNLVVVVDGDNLEYQFNIDESNKLLQQTVDIPTIPTNVILDMEGEGCALVQAVLRYNIPDPDASEVFKLKVETSTAPDTKCVTKRIKACASYHHPDEKSNMALIEVNLVSGYIPEKADLKRIVGYGAGLIKRYEVDGSKVTFYIDEFSQNDICVNFRILREVEMEDVKPGTVKVYDYYQPEFVVSETYTLPENNVCEFGPLGFDIDGIIEGPIDYEVEPEGVPVDVDAIEGLLGALDG